MANTQGRRDQRTVVGSISREAEVIITISTIAGIKNVVNWLCQPHWFLIISTAGLAILVLGRRRLTRPLVASLFGAVAVLLFAGAVVEPNFRRIVTTPDNLAIVLLLFAVGFFLWLSFRKAAINDQRTEEGRPLIEAGAEEQVMVWPDLVHAELIVMVLATGVLVVWAILVPAPLEQPADPNIAPNPAKAPWYFLGLQEMLVYFDPWLAGVVLPGLIIGGLIAIPYLDKNPRGNGYYTFKERPFAITTFLFGFLILWVMLIVFGTFFRGPNWNFFGPFEYWDPNRPTTMINVELHELFWGILLDRRVPEHHLIRELPGIVLLAGYFLAGPPALRRLFFRRTYRRLGFVRYSVLSMLLLVMLLMPIKMVLRWTLNLHYILGLPEWSLNI